MKFEINYVCYQFIGGITLALKKRKKEKRKREEEYWSLWAFHWVTGSLASLSIEWSRQKVSFLDW
jgi:hypothetical protein